MRNTNDANGVRSGIIIMTIRKINYEVTLQWGEPENKQFREWVKRHDDGNKK